MKIVPYPEFVRLPEGTIYSHYEPCVLSGLFRRGRVIHNDAQRIIDFYEMDLLAAPDLSDGATADDLAQPMSPPADSWCRWGLFDDTALFVVYEPVDILTMISGLTLPAVRPQP